MGGNVGVIIKKEDGEQIGMSRWTNVMPYFFRNINLYKGNTKVWFEEFCQEWLLMKEDYEANKDTGQYKLNMTPVYFPSNTLSPDEYGIIAVDLQNKKIYSSQDYCSIGNLAFYHVWSGSRNNEENISLLKDYFEHDFLKEVSYYSHATDELVKVDISSMLFEEIIQLLKEATDRKVLKFSHNLFKDISKEDLDLYSSSFLINSDWKLTTYNDRAVGVLKIKKELNEDGFVFTDEDNQSWKDYVSYRWSYSDDEELKDNKEYEEFKKIYKEVFNEEFVIVKQTDQ